jgi:membrane-bound lytic murein transglycosylase A
MNAAKLPKAISTLLVAALMMSTSADAAEFSLHQTSYENLAGWQSEDHSSALKVLLSACTELTTSGVGFARSTKLSGSRKDWLPICQKASRVGSSTAAARKFFENELTPVNVSTVGQFTGYFEPEVAGSRRKTKTFNVPVLAKPDDLVKLTKAAAVKLGVSYGRIEDGKAKPYFTRQQIEQGKLASRKLEIAYLRSWEDLFFMQVQGSGRIKLRNGERIRLGYAAKTGLPYTSIGKVLINEGKMTREEMSMQALRGWLESRPKLARQIMWQNRSYVFFRELAGLGSDTGPVGAQMLPLTPLRSLAVDRRYWALGVPLWISTSVYANGQAQPFKQIVIAQDTGSAIRGPARGDVFMGTGQQAGLDAGLMDQSGSMIALLPHALARRLIEKYAK